MENREMVKEDGGKKSNDGKKGRMGLMGRRNT